VVLISDSCADLGKSDTKIKTEGQQSPKVGEFESCEKGTPEDKPDEEDVCPICLEGLFFLSWEPQLFILTCQIMKYLIC
jgi:hypothetical protein